MVEGFAEDWSDVVVLAWLTLWLTAVDVLVWEIVVALMEPP